MSRLIIVLLLIASRAAAQCTCPCPCTPTPLSTATPVVVSTPTPGAQWAIRDGGNTTDVGTAVTVGPDGTIYVAGFFTGIASFGALGSIVGSGMDVFVAKYSAAGFPIWVVHGGNAASNSALAVALDHQGNVLVGGRFQRTLNLGCGPMNSAVPDSYDAFVAKFSPAGTCVWSKNFGSGGDDMATGVATDGADNVILVGEFTGRVSLGGAAMFSSNTTGGPSTFIAKYDPTGAFRWSKNFSPVQSNNGPDVAYGVAVEPTRGEILVTGEFQGMEYFDGTTPVASVGNSPDFYLADFAGDGTFRWAITHGSTGSERSYAVTVDHAGNAIITGYFAGSVDFGGTVLQATGPLNGFVAQYATTPPLGALVWAKAITGTGVNFGQGLAVDDDNNTVVTGQFQTTTNFGGTTLTSLGQSDIFVARYTAGGLLTSARGFGSTATDVGYSVATTPDGDPIATGYFRNAMFIGPTLLTSLGQTDIYLIKTTP